MLSDQRAMPIEYTHVLRAAMHKPMWERNQATTNIASKIEVCIGFAIQR